VSINGYPTDGETRNFPPTYILLARHPEYKDNYAKLGGTNAKFKVRLELLRIEGYI